MITVKYFCIVFMWVYFVLTFIMDTKYAADETRSNLLMTPADKASLRACIRADIVGIVVCLLGMFLLK